MVWSFIGFGAVFILGAIMTVVGGTGVGLMDCPAIISEFSAQETTCKLFSLLVFVGGFMTVIGGAVASGVLVFGKFPN